jgi:predicted DNA-binding protein (UPF0251 family)
MSLSSRIKDLAADVATKVAELDKRIPNHVDDKGKVTEFHPTEPQIEKIAKAAVNVAITELEVLIVEQVVADSKKGAIK